MKNTALFALSSPEGSQNYFSKLLTLKLPDGEPFFQVCDCQLICSDCRKLEREQQILCNHVKQTAHWLSSKKSARINLLYAADPTTAIKEMFGLIEDDFIPCFPKDLIHQCFNAPDYVTKVTPKYVFTTVDPSGGGISQLAICTGYYDEDLNYVVRGKTKTLFEEKRLVCLKRDIFTRPPEGRKKRSHLKFFVSFYFSPLLPPLPPF